MTAHLQRPIFAAFFMFLGLSCAGCSTTDEPASPTNVAGSSGNNGSGGTSSGTAGQGGTAGSMTSTGGQAGTSSGTSGTGGTSGAGGTSGTSGSGGTTSGTAGSGSGNQGECASFQTSDTRFPSSLAATYLDIHNKKRAQYCLNPLTWDSNLAKVAQAYAEKGAGNLPHNPNRNAEYAALIGCSNNCPELGENISWQEPWDFWPIDTLADGWLEEENDQPGCNYGGSHYTQMVQEKTTRVGCGAWIDPNKRLHFVCNYLGWQYGGPAFPDANCSCGGKAYPSANACN
jgi:uncharacterized protein YkwD